MTRRWVSAIGGLLILACTSCSSNSAGPFFTPTMLQSAESSGSQTQSQLARKFARSRYVVTNLGSLGGTSCCLVITDNDRGWVDFTSNMPGDTSFHPVVWANGHLTDLGTLGGPNSSVGQMDDRGDVTVGGSDTGLPDPLGEDFCSFGTHQTCLSFVWHDGERKLIPTLGGNNNDIAAIHDSGLVLAFAETSTHDPTCAAPQVLGFEAFTWQSKSGEIRTLPALAVDSDSAAFDMNDNNDAVGYSGPCGTGAGDIFAESHAVLWQNHIPIDLGNLGGTIANAAFGVNNRGQVSGVSALPGNTTAHAFLWQTGVMTDLGTLPGDILSVSGNINDPGQVPIQSCVSIGGSCRAAVWQHGVMTDLNALIPADSPLYLVLANWVNNRGQIVGQAFDKNTGALVPFLATPCDGANEDANACKESFQTAASAHHILVLPKSVLRQLWKQPSLRGLAQLMQGPR